ncbi:hypothetical protein EBU24_04190 [bacterium]|nr:hypothetical protein [bacterium]
MNEIPDNSKNTNYKLFVLDPLSVIIKLAILSNKPIGTKFRINDNVMYIQEPGYFQSVCRIYYNSNKTELQYLYNPINFACNYFLCSRFTDKTPSIKKLFSCAIQGLDKLKDTYKTCPVIVLCLNLYINLIENSLEEYMIDKIFKKDAMTSIYDDNILKNLNSFWTTDRIKVVLDMIEFLCKDYSASNNVQSLEIFINNIDLEIVKLVNQS